MRVWDYLQQTPLWIAVLGMTMRSLQLSIYDHICRIRNLKKNNIYICITCIYICVDMYIYTGIYIYIHIHIYIHIRVCVFIFIFTYIYIYVYIQHIQPSQCVDMFGVRQSPLVETHRLLPDRSSCRQPSGQC